MRKNYRHLFLAALLALALLAAPMAARAADYTLAVDGVGGGASDFASLADALDYANANYASNTVEIIITGGDCYVMNKSILAGHTVINQSSNPITGNLRNYGRIEGGNQDVTIAPNYGFISTTATATCGYDSGFFQYTEVTARTIKLSGMPNNAVFNGDVWYTDVSLTNCTVNGSVSLGNAFASVSFNDHTTITGEITGSSSHSNDVNGNVTIGSYNVSGGPLHIKPGSTLNILSPGTGTILGEPGSRINGLYSILLDPAGGEVGGSTGVYTLGGGEGTNVVNEVRFTLPAATRQGGVFSGWLDSGGVTHPAGTTIDISSAAQSGQTMTAQWSADTGALASLTVGGVAATIDNTARTATVTVPTTADLMQLVVNAVAGPGQTIQEGATFTVDASGGTFTVTVLDIANNPILYTVTVRRATNASSGDEDTFEPVLLSHEQAIVVGVKEWANVRESPSTEAAIVGQVYLGESISLLQWNKDETWCKIMYDGDSRLGWLYYKFIRPVK